MNNKGHIEYKAYNLLRRKVRLPFIIRWFFAVIFIFIGLVFIILPVFPGSLLVGIFLFVVGSILIVAVNKLRYLIKLRRSITYMFTNLFKKDTRNQKIRDIKKHLRKIFDIKKKR